MADLTIAKTIHSQLLGLGKIKVWSWGAHSYKGGENFLRFRVNGHKFQGIVKISLNGMDYYDIDFIKVHNKTPEEVVHSLKDVCFDEMVDLID